MTRKKPISRRGALGGILVLKSQTAFGTEANSAVSFGILGTGGRGRFVGGLMAKDPRARLAALCDLYPDQIDRAKSEIAQAAGVPSVKDYRDLLERRDMDAVLIATPVFLHPEHFEAAVLAGKHVYCEKPAGVDVRGVLRVQKAGEQAAKDRTLFFGFQQRFSPEYLAAEKLIRGGHLGQITLMISYWIWGGSAFLPGAPPLPNPEDERIRKWGRYRATSGDILVEQDCHGIDVMNWFAQAHPVSAVGDGGRNWRSTGDNSDHVSVSFRYPGKVKGWMLGTQLPPLGYRNVREEIFGSKASLVMTRNSMEWIEAGKNEGARTISKREITIDAVEAFLTSIRDQKSLNMTKDSCESTLTAILGRMAADQRREITWQEMLETA
jgi:predicted dehydrogenase